MLVKYKLTSTICLKVFFREQVTLLLLCFLLFPSSCSKFVTVSPPNTSITGSDVFNADATAIAVVTNVYINMSSSSFPNGGITSMSLFSGLSADELSVFGYSNSTYVAYYTNALKSSNTGGSDFWNAIYPIIYVANSAIDGLNSSSGLTPAVKQQLIGEAEFIRAFCYFYLVNLYGDVPLETETNYKSNETLARTPQAKVWGQIVADLKNAQSLLSSGYVDATLLNNTIQRVRPTSWAATALLARAYLYQQQWDSAAAEATAVINNLSMFSLDTLNGVFLANSNEAIWQLQPVNVDQNTQDAVLFVLPPSGPSDLYPIYLDSILVDAFEPGDQRKVNWVDSVNVNGLNYYYAYKYKVNVLTSTVTEYEMILRLGEQYLIRSEAEAQLGEFAAATTDLDTIRSRAGLPAITATSQANILTAIYHERQVELFTEWGHRWLDLKRTGHIDSVMGSPGNVCQNKGGSWNSNWQWYPIPLYDIQHDPNLVQNPMY